jgi:hypothetical protein
VTKSAIAVFVVIAFLSASPVQAGAMDFGPGLPADWFSTAWSAGGSATPTNGSLTVDGARAGTTALYSPGRSLQFEATFTGDAWQHIGFGTDFSNGPWAIFSTFDGSGFYARTSDDSGQTINFPLPGSLIGTSHRYRIDWNPTNVVFSVDDTVVATNNAVIATALRPLVSDLNVGGGVLSVASIELFTSVTALDLSGSSLPAGWSSSPWASGGAATVAGGTLTIDGAAAGTTAVYSSGVSLEFTAMFSGDPWQHIGFGTDFNAGPWAIFSTFQGTGQLYARTSDGSGNAIDTPIPGNWFGTPHRYRIDWNPMDAVFWIDGVVVASNAATISTGLRPLASDFNVGGGTVNVGSMELIASSFNLDFAPWTLPSGWSSGAWATGGAATVSNGTLTVDGALAGTNALTGPGGSVQFVATFSGDAWQHLGFGIDYSNPAWIVFSTYDGSQLYARTADEFGNTMTTALGNLSGTPHTYRIDWSAGNIVFSIDGTVVATHAMTVGVALRPLVSDFTAGGGTLSVASVTMQ